MTVGLTLGKFDEIGMSWNWPDILGPPRSQALQPYPTKEAEGGFRPFQMRKENGTSHLVVVYSCVL